MVCVVDLSSVISDHARQDYLLLCQYGICLVPPIINDDKLPPTAVCCPSSFLCRPIEINPDFIEEISEVLTLIILPLGLKAKSFIAFVMLNYQHCVSCPPRPVCVSRRTCIASNADSCLIFAVDINSIGQPEWEEGYNHHLRGGGHDEGLSQLPPSKYDGKIASCLASNTLRTTG